MQNDDLVAKAVDYLNSIHVADPAAINSLLWNRVPCNKTIADHPTCQVWQVSPSTWTVGLLGLVNGMLDSMNLDRIAVVVNEADPNTITRFEKFDPDSPMVQKAKDKPK